jgi:hypothetical protein
MGYKIFKSINILTILALLLILAFFWIYHNSQFYLAASITVYAIFAILYISIRKSIRAKGINILMLPVLLIFFAFFWIFLYVPFSFVAILMVCTLLAVLYVNLKESINGYIDAGKTSSIPADTEGERRLEIVKYLVIAFALGLILFFSAFAWIYMNAQFAWAILIDIIIVALASFINLVFTARYYIIKKTEVSIIKVTMAIIALIIVIACFFIPLITRISMPVPISYSTLMLLLFLAFLMLLGFIYVNLKRAVDVLKKIKNKPTGLINDRRMKIFNYVLLISIIIIIVVIRIYLHGLAYLGANQISLVYTEFNLISFIILLFIATNIMKLIWDIS